jgi:indolepyruvate ferredoxin oxidoreductase
VSDALDGLGADGHARAVELARLPESIRGYEDIKLRSIAQARHRAEQLGVRL